MDEVTVIVCFCRVGLVTKLALHQLVFLPLRPRFKCRWDNFAICILFNRIVDVCHSQLERKLQIPICAKAPRDKARKTAINEICIFKRDRLGARVRRRK
jgi:hypothetical protein